MICRNVVMRLVLTRHIHAIQALQLQEPIDKMPIQKSSDFFNCKKNVHF